MGQRAAHETFLAIVGAFVTRRRWTQAELARQAGVSTEAIRKHMTKMQEDGWPFKEQKDHPHVIWRAPTDWYPGVLAFKADEVPDLLRLLARSPRSAGRERLLKAVFERLPLKDTGTSFEKAVRSPALSPDEEQWVPLLEDAAARKLAVRMHYSTASRRDDGTRHVSVHHVEAGASPRFLATCHNSGKLKWFRVAGIANAKHDRTEAFRDEEPDRIAAFERDTVGGFRAEGAPVACAFFVRQPEAAWVKRNLLQGMKQVATDGGIRVEIETAALNVVARYVVGLGVAARAETPVLAEQVRAIARGALESTHAAD